NPGLLWFLSLGSIPIIIHLLNRQKHRRVKWAAMDWLLAAIRKTRKRLRLENLILLIVRVLVISLLVLALARPHFRAMPLKFLETSDRFVLLVIDNSYSMGKKSEGTTPFDRAKAVADTLIDGMSPAGGDRVGIVLMSSKPSKLIAEPSMLTDRAKKLVAELALSDYGTSLTASLPLVAEALKESKNSKKELYILTDFQRYGWDERGADDRRLAELLDAVKKETSAITLIDVGFEDLENVGVVSVAVDEKVAVAGTMGRFRAIVKNFGTQEVSSGRLNVSANGQKVNTLPFSVSPGGEVSVPFVLEMKDPIPLGVSVEVESDSLPGDNFRHLALDVRESVRVLVVNGVPAADPAEDETAFFRYALNPTRDPAERVAVYDVKDETKFTFADVRLRNYDIAVVANLDTVLDERARDLDDFVRAGGGLLIFLGDRVDRETYNRILYRGGDGLLPAKLVEVRGDKTDQQDLRFTKADFTHPGLSYFEPFKLKLRDFITFEYYATEADTARPDVRVLVRYDDADSSPAIVEKRLGRGAVMLVTTSCDRDWNIWSMTFNQAYLILVDQLCLTLAAQPGAYKNLEVGESIEYVVPHVWIERDERNEVKPFTLRLPSRGSVDVKPSPISEEKGEFVVAYSTADAPGIYALDRPRKGAGSGELATYFAANVDPLEGNLTRLGPDEIRRRFPQFEFEYIGGARGERTEKVEAKPPTSHIWKALMYVVLGLLLVEMLLAQRFSRNR
ncbi:MAG: BatA domain-containing protein, partial [Planctomycetota bacterium]|nr:BatA domain-containing protein [Planctomycetota bacterium]